jgi:hypothetical protein
MLTVNVVVSTEPIASNSVVAPYVTSFARGVALLRSPHAVTS